VEVSQEVETESEGDKHEDSQSGNKSTSEEKDKDQVKEEEGDDQFNKPTNETDASGKRLTTSSPQPKMRYRCKLCGQPKQNHTCPYQQSLARSIGVQIYPCVNAFTAAEPGTIAPALSDMNNFVDVKEPGSNESSPSRPSPDRVRRHHAGASGTVTSTTQITPESMRSSPRLHSPPPSLITSPAAPRTPSRRNNNNNNNGSGSGGGGSGGGGMSRVLGQAVAVGGRKRSHGQMNGSMMMMAMMMENEPSSTTTTTDLLFLDAMEIKPEQFRVVSASKAMALADAFNYPALPLPYAQRKRLSDNLFSLSNEVPKLTDECAQVLREAREKDMWDLAVAELMTQVVVIIHCPDGDNRFEGLRQYLLTLGIAC